MSDAANRPLHVSFVAGATGAWKIDSLTSVRGESLPFAEGLQVIEGGSRPANVESIWTLSGVTSNARYSTRGEVDMLAGIQEGLGRPEATCAAFIPIRKSDAWWVLTQDERRSIFEEQSHHIAVGVEYLPAIARRLHHCRDLGGPFDFLTWFEYAPEHGEAFEEMVRRLRDSEEWGYVEREVDVRLSRV